MTAPNQESPPGAYGPSTVASLQDVTQTTVGQQQSADTRALLAQVQTTFIGNLLGGFGNVLDGIGGAINQLISDLVLALKGITGGFIDLTGFLHDTRTTATTAKSTADQVATVEVPRLDNRIDKLANGDEIYLFTSNGTFTLPDGAVRVGVGLIGGGDGGQSGFRNTGSPSGGAGGDNGGYVFRWFDAADITAPISVTIGLPGAGAASATSGNGGTAGGQGGKTRFGTLLESIETGTGLIIADEGLLSAAATAPGSGGKGASIVDDAGVTGVDGQNGGLTQGGNAAGYGADGGNGQSVDIAGGQAFSGGAGGGGGGYGMGNAIPQRAGGNGGNGGWPGGGGGGGGGTQTSLAPIISNGGGGNGAAGAARIIVKFS
ncbi:glycine-rich domain-containing protein [Rhodococcus opacus]|uniref:glycine-rich domain-containing protein n=1 Tax=Rhodococcus opacus TaxID=37919 RepID=UPI00155AB857|nr:hypothetical protein [Rhodococcus opacus]